VTSLDNITAPVRVPCQRISVLDGVREPADLRRLDLDELTALAAEIAHC